MGSDPNSSGMVGLNAVRSSTLLLAGGGALYTDLVNCFHREFDGILYIQVVDDPIALASTGYCLRSLSLSEGQSSVAVGLDIGNAQTVISVTKDGMQGAWN